MRILAIDPSLRGTGFAILEEANGKTSCREYAVIKNHSSLSQEGCLIAIYEKLGSVIERHTPTALAIEKVIFVCFSIGD